MTNAFNDFKVPSEDVSVGSPAYEKARAELGKLTTEPRVVNPSVPQWAAAVLGALKGASLNWHDEIRGASEASGLPGVLGGFRAPVGLARLGYENWIQGEPGEATHAYTAARDDSRDVSKAAATQHPMTTLGGELVGSLALPVGSAAQGAGLGARTLRSGLIGAGYGTLAGAGEGETPEERANKGLVGGSVGAGVGMLFPAALDAAGTVGRYTSNLARSAASNLRGPEAQKAEAARQVTEALLADRRAAGRMGLTQEEAATAQAANQPVVIADIGGETTRALARKAANTSPEARQILGDFINPRYESQGFRAIEFVRSLVESSGEAVGTKEAISKFGRELNNRLYSASRAEFADGIPWTSPLAEVTQTPAVIEAMKGAARSIENRVGAGRTTPAIVGPERRLTLEAWDLVKRNLDGRIGVARRSGDKTLVQELMGVRNALVKELDTATINPTTGMSSYQMARGAAAEVFGALDAIEAGEKFVSSKMRNEDARRAVARFSPEDRMAFAEGYVSEFVNKVQEVGYRRDIVNALFNSPAAKERAKIALGDNAAKQLETFFKVESVMDKLRGAMGNSTTARQLSEMGAAGGLYGYQTNDFSPANILKGAFLFKGVKEGAKFVARRGENQIATHVAELLTSNDPTLWRQGVHRLSQSPRMMENLKRFEAHLGKIVGFATVPENSQQ